MKQYIIYFIFALLILTGCGDKADKTTEETKQNVENKAEDVASANMIATSVNLVLKDEGFIDLLPNVSGKAFSIEESEDGKITFSYQKEDVEYMRPFTEAVGKYLGFNTPNIIYETETWKPKAWVVSIRCDSIVEIYITDGPNLIMLYPYTDSMYR